MAAPIWVLGDTSTKRRPWGPSTSSSGNEVEQVA